MKFDCDRTCLLYERVDRCRFNPVIPGRQIVNSHTVRVEVNYQDLDALGRAIEGMGGVVLGNGEHHLFQGDVNGFGFKMPNWRYPLVCAGGKLAYDDYRGSWGDVADLAKLESAYAVESAAQACERLGWMFERTDSGLRVFHPSGGTLEVNSQGVDASGFSGTGCHDASMALAAALGRAAEITVKPEYHESRQQVTELD